MSNTKFFETEVINLKAVQKLQFSIPTYQRPYVWGEEQINKLITDFYKSFDLDKQEPYYIGTILTKEIDNYADLIDGQQRFTTLWLTAFVFRKLNIATELQQFLEVESKLRLGFEIRKEVERYLNQLLGKSDKEKTIEISSAEIAELPYLQNIATGLATLENIIKQFVKADIAAFGDYIYNQVFLVKNTTPHHIDLNKLFATINSAGVQLEQTDIVKSNLLRHLAGEKVLYSKIWESCENMHNFFERNARVVFSESDWKSIDMRHYIPFSDRVFKYKVEVEELAEERKKFTLNSILAQNDMVYENHGSPEQNENTRESEEIYCRSIINFGQLLLHTYRLHLKKERLADFQGTFHTNRLVEIFGEMEKRKDDAEIKRFFLLLWDIRFVFDKYVIKWVSDLDLKTEHLELVNISRNEDSYYSRSNYAKSSSLMLQSVLYFTGDYLRQFWLTPFLEYVFNNKHLEPTSKQILNRLEEIDNQMSLCKSRNGKDASFDLLSIPLRYEVDIRAYLESNNGTSFNHYWFQKLEYVLWKHWENREKDEFRNFRITSKNSIEHIHPQSKADQVEISKDDFGNLVLLSVAQNSEYSNKEVNVKKQEFLNKSTYDSLKSYYIFNNTTWNASDIEIHRELMISKLLSHYN
jgi:uncharacterized protein with ParB-like and HNH nuclease domain